MFLKQDFQDFERTAEIRTVEHDRNYSVPSSLELDQHLQHHCNGSSALFIPSTPFLSSYLHCTSSSEEILAQAVARSYSLISMLTRFQNHLGEMWARFLDNLSLLYFLPSLPSPSPPSFIFFSFLLPSLLFFFNF